MIGIMIAGVVSIVFFLGIMKLGSSGGDRKVVKQRLDSMVDEQSSYDEDDENAITSSAEKMERIMGKIGADKPEEASATKKALMQAGAYSPSAVVYYNFAKSLGWLGGLIVAIFLISIALQHDGKIKFAIFGVAGVMFLLFTFGAKIWLSNTKTKRFKILQRSFPDTLDLLLVCVESGLALDASLARVCRELSNAHPEITKELNKTRMDLTLMGDREAALNDLAERTGMPAFKALVVALVQSEKFGTSLSDTLRVLADDYRQERMMIAEEKAGRLPALMTVPMMLFMLPALMLIIVGPAIIQVLATFRDN